MAPEGQTSLDVLLIEDSEDDASLLKRQLETAGYAVTLERVDTAATLTTALARGRWDIVFSDFSMPRFDGVQALKIVREHDRDLPFIILSGTIGEERAAQLMKLGAHDYVIKGNVRRLVPAIEREIQEAKVRREHRLAQEHIRHLAYYDPLTRLPNRHRLTEDLKQSLELASAVTLILINAVNFREVNGALGYRNGDQLIREAAGRLQDGRLHGGTVYHVYGNEFAVLLQGDDRAIAETMAEEALKAFAAAFVSSGLRIRIGARAGIVASRLHDNDPYTLMQQADLAARSAKREGRWFAWYDPERDPSSPDRLAMLADLYDALRTDQLYLALQPKIDHIAGVAVGAEALLRWRHPEHGLIATEKFIELAESSGIIDDIARDVLQRTVKQLHSWRRKSLRLPIAINLSPKNLLNSQLMEEILSVDVVNGDGARAVEVEITETALMRNPDQALASLRKLNEAGTRIYIDDYGTGFSSLGYLKKLPIHAVKIDKSFILDLIRNADSDTIVRSTINLAHNLGLKVVAEGVEQREVWERLAGYGCDQGQGHYFAPPLKAEEFERRYAKKNF